MRTLLLSLPLLFTLPLAQAQTTNSANNLDELLQNVKQRQSEEKALYREREQSFLNARNQQKQLLEQARTEFLAAQKRNNPLQQQADTNAAQLHQMQQELQQHITDLGDIYSIYNEFAGDFIARMQDSLVHTQLSERQNKLQEIHQRDTLPSVEEMRELWVLLQEEMTEAGKIRTYPADVIQADGSVKQQQVTRISTFSMTSNGKLLRYLPQSNELVTLARQPPGVSDSISTMEQGNEALLPVVIDPTRGQLLGLLGQSPTLGERISQGKEVGFAIIALGAAGLLLAFYRLGHLGLIWLKTRKQLTNIAQPLNNNPLGRVLQQAAVLEQCDEETLQSKLDEAILKEMPALEQGQGLIKLLAAIAPLLGLLGTVIGMIATFQSISLFGSGDPKLMASGISQALVTTVLGLVAAIPLLFSHNLVAALSRSLVQVLDEQSAGILARHLEASHSQNNQSKHDV